MANIYEMILSEASRRQVVYADNYFPFYIASLGCHVLHKLNREREIYTEGTTIPNLRLHILMVAYPGFGKTYFLKQFVDDKRYSFFKATSVKCKFKSGDMTGASFKGKVYTDDDGKVQTEFGTAHPDKDGTSILGVEEFSAVTNSFKQTYNSNLDTGVLTALDNGKVDFERGAGGASYETFLTMWAGVQPARYDIGAGFSRRFIFTSFFPTIKDIEHFRDVRRRAKGIKIDISKLKNIRHAINQRKREIENNLTRITFSQDFYAALNKYDQMHYDDELFERLGIGYWLMRSEHIQDQLYVRMEPELQRLFDLLKDYEQTIRDFGPSKVVWRLISSEDKIQKYKVLNYAAKLGLSNNETQGAINYLVLKKKIERGDKNELVIKKD